MTTLQLPKFEVGAHVSRIVYTHSRITCDACQGQPLPDVCVNGRLVEVKCAKCLGAGFKFKTEESLGTGYILQVEYGFGIEPSYLVRDPQSGDAERATEATLRPCQQ